MRVNFINTQITKLAIHIVGNKIADEGMILSKSCLTITNDLEDVLSNYFLGSFKTDEYFHLYHDTCLNLNEVFTYVSEIFNDPNSFLDQSINLAKHLYNQSLFPNIKEGEFYVVYFQGIKFDGQNVDVIGIFKTEKKSTFLKTSVNGGRINLQEDKGIDLRKLDKGCLIFNMDKENGFIVSIIDNTNNKGSLAKYWINDFLHVRQINDTYTNTENLMSLTKTFITKELPRTGMASKTEQIGLLNKTLQYFRNNDFFNLENFAEEVIAKPEIAEKFHNFKSSFEASNDLTIDNKFQISDTAIKQQQRAYRRAISLDKKIQIIIKGNSDCVEKGTDSRGKFYKIYYQNEE